METSSAAQPLTTRFVAGLTLDDALRTAASLRQQGVSTSLDYLGENVRTLEEAGEARNAYLTALGRLSAAGLDGTVSMKVTALGLDMSEEACWTNTEALVARARELGSTVEMDMEASEYTDRNLRLVHAMQERGGHVRAVIQAYLFRSEADIRALNGKAVPVRLCKGAYREPPHLAYPLKQDVDGNYIRLLRLLFDEGAFPAIATHDEAMVAEAMRYSQQRGIAKDRWEFQMLYGVRRDLQKKVLDQGYRLRLYVPYGAAWYPYFMRRLAERPANVWFLARSVLRP